MNENYDTQTGIEVLYRKGSLQYLAFQTDIVEKFNSFCDHLELTPIQDHIDYNTDFVIPEYYQQLDVRAYIIQCLENRYTEFSCEQLERIDQELELFEARNLFPVLQMLIYIVDTMRRNNIVWGVGRGSSVASYCLYLLDVHRIDSIKYGLDIREFLR